MVIPDVPARVPPGYQHEGVHTASQARYARKSAGTRTVRAALRGTVPAAAAASGRMFLAVAGPLGVEDPVGIQPAIGVRAEVVT